MNFWVYYLRNNRARIYFIIFILLKYQVLFLLILTVGIFKIFSPCESYAIVDIFSLKNSCFFLSRLYPAYFHFYDVLVAIFNILTDKL